MPLTSVSAVRKQIADGKPDPVYLLVGEDDVEKSALAAEFGELVDEGLRAFNTEKIHAGEFTTGDRLLDGVTDIVTACRTLPMMSPRRVVTVTQAENLLAPKRESEAADRALEQFATLLDEPDPQTILVLVVAGTLDKRSRGYKQILKRATVVECGVIEDQADAERWVRNRVAAQGAEIEPAAARLIAERAGADLKRLRGDIDRLLLYALGQKTITVADVRDLVGPAALQNEWAMSNAIEAGNVADALRQLALLLDAGVRTEVICGQIGSVVRRTFPATAPKELYSAVAAVFRTDLDLKGSGGDPRVLLDRLVVELCAGKRARGGPARRW